MFHVPITKCADAARIIEFCHISNPSAHPGTWKKGKYISLDNVKINVFVKGDFSLFYNIFTQILQMLIFLKKILKNY